MHVTFSIIQIFCEGLKACQFPKNKDLGYISFNYVLTVGPIKKNLKKKMHFWLFFL